MVAHLDILYEVGVSDIDFSWFALFRSVASNLYYIATLDLDFLIAFLSFNNSCTNLRSLCVHKDTYFW